MATYVTLRQTLRAFGEADLLEYMSLPTDAGYAAFAWLRDGTVIGATRYRMRVELPGTAVYVGSFFEVARERAVEICRECGLMPPSSPATQPAAANPNPPTTALPATPQPPTKKKRRGRTAGVDKIGEAITVLNSRLKDGLSVSLPEIAKQVGCTPKNLQNSDRFLDARKTLLTGMTRAVRARGAKTGGSLEAYVDPREDAEEDF